MKGSYSGIAFHLRGHCPTAEPARRPPDTADQHAPTSRRSTRERERITRAPALTVTPLTRFTVGHRASGNAAGRLTRSAHKEPLAASPAHPLAVPLRAGSGSSAGQGPISTGSSGEPTRRPPRRLRHWRWQRAAGLTSGKSPGPSAGRPSETAGLYKRRVGDGSRVCCEPNPGHAILLARPVRVRHERKLVDVRRAALRMGSLTGRRPATNNRWSLSLPGPTRSSHHSSTQAARR